jgi:hypothetical protein
MYKKRLAKDAYLQGRWRESVALGRDSVNAFLMAGESTTTFDAFLVLAAGYLSFGDRASALSVLRESDSLLHLADPRSMPQYTLLLDAAQHGKPIDLELIDRHPYS